MSIPLYYINHIEELDVYFAFVVHDGKYKAYQVIRDRHTGKISDIMEEKELDFDSLTRSDIEKAIETKLKVS
jgi:hypothetical protein